jgi:hypothetical protein
MQDPMSLVNSWFAVIAHMIGTHAGDPTRDRGAVSIEQVLWYAAAAISVAVVAAIIWSQIRTTASTPVQSPSAP